jgi:NAD(P)-dependent dehydrogenase (short-subunit alcohol dehydrogenase family)
MLNQAIFLVSGGGRGITAQCVIALARRHACRFILLGRTGLKEEPDHLRDCLSEADLKTKIITQLKGDGERVTPAKVQKIVDEILAVQEIQQTIRAISEVGGAAEYLQCDVVNDNNLPERIKTSKFGRVTGIIHGAGVLSDALIEKKTLHDFNRVYAPKILGLQNLLRSVDCDRLNYLILFSSIASFYGNIGQSDYAIANEILNKFSHAFKAQYPECHVLAFDWGPWDGGMVTPWLKQKFEEANVAVIPVERGCQIFVDFLSRNNSYRQILVSGSSFPFQGGLDTSLRHYKITRKLSLDTNSFLHDHTISGHPVLPATCAAGWMESSCEKLHPGYIFHQSENFKVLKGIVFDGQMPDHFLLEVQECEKTPQAIVMQAVIKSELSSGLIRFHYSTQVCLVPSLPQAPLYKDMDLKEDPEFSVWRPYADGTLFHGASFQIIQRIVNADDERLTVECRYAGLPREQQGQFAVTRFSSICRDVQFQCMGMWIAKFQKAIGLPSSCTSWEYFREIGVQETFYVSVKIQNKLTMRMVADIYVHDHAGLLFSRALGAELTVSPQPLKNISSMKKGAIARARKATSPKKASVDKRSRKRILS